MRVPAINGLRALAIIGVVWHHSFFWYFAPSNVHSVYAFLVLPFLANGWLGVNLFFFLSGFVLYLPVCANGRALSGRQHVIDFYVRRAKRLLPLFYASLAVGFLLVNRDYSSGRFVDLGASCSLLFSFFGRSFFPKANFVLWSLGVEILFSLAFPYLVTLSRRSSLMTVVYGSVILAIVTRLLGEILFSPAPGTGYLNCVSDGIFGRIDDFVLGMLGASLHANRTTLPAASQKFWGAVWGAAGLVLLFSGMLILDFCFSGDINRGFAAFAYSFINFGILLTTNCALRSRLASWCLSLKGLQIVGMACYSVYAWHGLLLKLFFPQYDAVNLVPVSGFSDYPIFVACLIVVSMMSYVFIEFPCADVQTLFLLRETGDEDASVAVSRRR